MWNRALATGLIVLLLAVSVLPLPAHAQLFDDPYCDPHPASRAGSDGGTQHGGDVRVESASASEAGQHCEVCHWLRSLRAFDWQPAPALGPGSQAPIARTDPTAWTPFQSALSLAARAPPA